MSFFDRLGWALAFRPDAVARQEPRIARLDDYPGAAQLGAVKLAGGQQAIDRGSAEPGAFDERGKG